jgi:hypothetical protein
VEAVVLLANSAEATSVGTVSALGIGWSVTGTPTPPTAIIILIKVPWDQTNTQHILRLHLVDSDGNDVMMAHAPTGEDAPLEIQADFEVGRPAGLPRGTDIDHVIPLSIAPGMPLIPGQIYQWRLQIDGEEKAARSFLVRRSS